ncbi:hypothetical protein, partial [Bacillus licheniformis]|uniref:hypothetical protein n=1 Tax=Bacillus licheniformis TaxID=1402 RepID=UPI00163A3105
KIVQARGFLLFFLGELFFLFLISMILFQRQSQRENLYEEPDTRLAWRDIESWDEKQYKEALSSGNEGLIEYRRQEWEKSKMEEASFLGRVKAYQRRESMPYYHSMAQNIDWVLVEAQVYEFGTYFFSYSRGNMPDILKGGFPSDATIFESKALFKT